MKSYFRQMCAGVYADFRKCRVALAVLILYTAAVNLLFHAFCPMVIVCGLPCPGCGLSRAALCVLTGRWRQAWQLNPMIFPIAAAACYFAWNRYIRRRRAAGMTAVIAALAVMLLAVYAVRMYLYFPNRIPYVYTADNMLARVLALRSRFSG